MRSAFLAVLFAAFCEGVEKNEAVVQQKYFEFFVGGGTEKTFSFFHVAVFYYFYLHVVLDF